jgi:hypothetical protein
VSANFEKLRRPTFITLLIDFREPRFLETEDRTVNWGVFRSSVHITGSRCPNAGWRCANELQAFHLEGPVAWRIPRRNDRGRFGSTCRSRCVGRWDLRAEHCAANLRRCVRPERAAKFGLRAYVDVSSADWRKRVARGGRWDLRTEHYDTNSPRCFGPEQVTEGADQSE